MTKISDDDPRAEASESSPGASKTGAATGSRPLDLPHKPLAAKAPPPKPAKKPSGPIHLPDIAAMIAVASGKGGVGKSTVASNLAVALAAKGLRVGLLDADIYGPSAPTLFGLVGAKPDSVDGKIIPFEKFGVKVMSIGFLVDPDRALVWRGLMVMSAVTQLLRDVAWGPLDILVLDMPPGTGDAQLTVAQKVKLKGAVIVSTPQELALADARRGVAMFGKTDVPILGVIENMAYFEDAAGEKTYIFGEGGARRTAQELGAPFLGEIPLYPELRASCDDGAPITATAPDSAPARVMFDIAENVRQTLAESPERDN